MNSQALTFMGLICNNLKPNRPIVSNISSQTILLKTLFPQNIQNQIFINCTCNEKQFFILSQSTENLKDYYLYQFEYSEVISNISAQKQINLNILNGNNTHFDFESHERRLFCSDNYIVFILIGNQEYSVFLYFLNTNESYFEYQKQTFLTYTGDNTFFAYKNESTIFTFTFSNQKWSKNEIRPPCNCYLSPSILYYLPSIGLCFRYKSSDIIQSLNKKEYKSQSSLPTIFEVQGLGLIGITEHKNERKLYHIVLDNNEIKLNPEYQLDSKADKGIKIENILNSFVPIQETIKWLREGKSCFFHSIVWLSDQPDSPEIDLMNFDDTNFDFLAE